MIILFYDHYIGGDNVREVQFFWHLYPNPGSPNPICSRCCKNIMLQLWLHF